MIIGIGTDIIKIERIQSLFDRFGEKFFGRILTENEISKISKYDNSKKKISFLAKRFSAKEAMVKATGYGFGRGINFSDIEIDNDDLGKPFIRLLNGKDNFLKKQFACKNLVVHLSLSDERDFAISYVIIEKLI